MTRFHHRLMAAQEVDGVSLIEALRWPDEDGLDQVHLFFRTGTTADTLGLDTAPDWQDVSVRALSGGLAVQARIPEGTPLVLPGGQTPIETVPRQWRIFRGLDAALVQRNGEDACVVVDWLRFHAREHGLQGALIVDRAAPDETTPLMEHLQSALAQSPIPGLAEVLILQAPRPLGRADMPAEAHPFCAPDAPGKDRMEAIAPDPWRAPLGEMTLYEACKWRHLAQARCVANLEINDILVPESGEGLFRRARGAARGVLPLVGRRIYPWRMRKGMRPGFGDHICDQFDNPAGNRRWIVVPRKAGLDQPWRLVRVGAVDSEGEEAGFFLRAMALRSPDVAPGALVPKTSLTPDDTLIDLARTHFGADPILPPGRPSSVAASAAMPAALPGRTAIVTCMKNEGPFVLEWIAWHRAIGVDDFLVYTNDCTDGTDTLLDLLQDQGILQHRDNPFKGTDLKPQHAALQAAEDEPIMARAGWGICMDVDEFINIHVGAGRLRDLYAAVGDANMISCTWRLFGNSDLPDYKDMPTPARFTRCAPQMIRKPHQAWGFKTLFRNVGMYKKMGVHRPKGLRPEVWEDIRWVNGSGQPMPREMLRNGWRSTVDTIGYDLVTLNHYAVRDAESFLVKRDRGRVNHVDRDQGLGYWFRMNNNATEDRSIMRMLPQFRAALTELMALPGVAQQHAECVARHRRRIAELRAAPAFAKIYAEITSARFQRLSRLHRHFGSNVFLAGPEVVPDHIVEAAHLAPDFFWTPEDVDETAH